MSLPELLAVLHEYRDESQVSSDAELEPVKLMTLHGAKGFSADVVIVPDLEDVIIPGDQDVGDVLV